MAVLEKAQKQGAPQITEMRSWAALTAIALVMAQGCTDAREDNDVRTSVPESDPSAPSSGGEQSSTPECPADPAECSPPSTECQEDCDVDDCGGASCQAGSGGVSGTGGQPPLGSCSAPEHWGPDSRNVPSLGEAGFDPAVDPGLHPAFYDDPDLYRCEDYSYVPSQAGDHELETGIVAVNYDVTGADDLRAVLTGQLTELEAGHGLALYLLNGTELNDEDLDFLQMLHSDSEGLGLSQFNTLHVYNLRSLRGGVESTSETAYGIPYPFLWSNGWQGPDSEVMKGEGGWVKHIVMDDLEEIQAGTFCDTMFESMSFKGVRVVRQMGLGFAPRAPATYLYMPSLEEAEMHAFRRRQRILKYNFPRLRELGDFAIDDNSRVEFINAPSLQITAERNSLNDPRDLIAFNYPSLEYMGLSCMGGTNDTTTVFRFPSMLNFDGSSLRGHSNMQFLWAPEATRFGPNVFVGNASLTDVYAPQVEDVGRFAFQDCIALTHLELPSATRIRHNAFDGATSLEEVRLPSVTQLDAEVFLNLPNLSRVYLGETPPEQGDDVFSGTSAELTIYYTGNDPGWESWSPAGNASANLVHED